MDDPIKTGNWPHKNISVCSKCSLFGNEKCMPHEFGVGPNFTGCIKYTEEKTTRRFTRRLK